MKLIKCEGDWLKSEMKVGQVMSGKPYSVGPDEPLSEVLTTMIERNIGSAFVVSQRGTVLGIFTAHDALAMLRALVLLGERERDRESEQAPSEDEPRAA